MCAEARKKRMRRMKRRLFGEANWRRETRSRIPVQAEKIISWVSSTGVDVLRTFSMIITRRVKKKKSNLMLIYRVFSTRQCHWHRCMIVTVILSRLTTLAFRNQQCPAELPADLRFISGSYLSDFVSLFIHYSASLQQATPPAAA